MTAPFACLTSGGTTVPIKWEWEDFVRPQSKSWWYSFFAACKAFHVVNANVASNAFTGTVALKEKL